MWPHSMICILHFETNCVIFFSFPFCEICSSNSFITVPLKPIPSLRSPASEIARTPWLSQRGTRATSPRVRGTPAKLDADNSDEDLMLTRMIITRMRMILMRMIVRRIRLWWGSCWCRWGWWGPWRRGWRGSRGLPGCQSSCWPPSEATSWTSPNPNEQHASTS